MFHEHESTLKKQVQLKGHDAKTETVNEWKKQ